MPSANVAISHSQTMTTATNVNTLHLTPEKCAVKNIHLNVGDWLYHHFYWTRFVKLCP